MCKLSDFYASKHVMQCQRLAESASIEPLVERSAYVGFIVQLHESGFEMFFKDLNALAAFEQVIERRIDEHDFSQLYVHSASRELLSDKGPRVVFDLDTSVIYHWKIGSFM